MQFTVSRDDLQKELHFLQGVAEKKKTIPILSNILLSAEGDALQLSATDLEVSLTTSCDAQVSEVGGITVSSKKFFEIVRSLPSEDMEISGGDGGALEIRCGKSFFKLVGLPVKDFPEMPSSDFSKGIKLPKTTLKKMISRTLFAVTKEDVRYSLNGALLEMSSGTMRMVATDAHRLAVVEYAEGSLAGGDEVRAIVPKKALAELRDLGEEGDVYFAQDENHLYFKVEHRVLSSRVIEGQFPAYNKVVPTENPEKVIFGVDSMANAIRRVSILANERSRAVKFTIISGEATISSSSPEMGEAQESVAVDYQGEGLEVSFNAQYVLDFLAVNESKQVIFHLKDDSSQGMLVPADQEEGDYRYVVMPMRL